MSSEDSVYILTIYNMMKHENKLVLIFPPEGNEYCCMDLAEVFSVLKEMFQRRIKRVYPAKEEPRVLIELEGERYKAIELAKLTYLNPRKYLIPYLTKLIEITVAKRL